MSNTIKEKAKILRLKKHVMLEEAPYIVIDKIGGRYNDVLALLIESVLDKSLPADVQPKKYLYTDAIIGAVDELKTSVATTDLLIWLERINEALPSDKWQSLYQLVQPYFEKVFAELPENVRMRWTRETCIGWDSMPGGWRAIAAQQSDFHHDPARKEENLRLFNLGSDIIRVKQEIEKWQLMSDHGKPTEAQTIEQNISRLCAELAELEIRDASCKKELYYGEPYVSSAVVEPASTVMLPEIEWEPVARPIDAMLAGTSSVSTTVTSSPVQDMKFISLSDVLVSMAEVIDAGPLFASRTAAHIDKISMAAAHAYWHAIANNKLLSNDEKVQWSRKMSHAALRLNNALLGLPDTPLGWAEFDGMKRINVSADSVKQEALELLDHAIGWGSRRENNYATHFRNSTTQGDAALSMSVIEGADDGLTKAGKQLRLMRICFERAALVKFLEANEIEHGLVIEPQAVSPAEPLPVVTADPLPTESTFNEIYYNNSKTVDWDKQSELLNLDAREAILLMHGLNPEAHVDKPVVPHRLRNDTQAEGFFRSIAHIFHVAESENLIRATFPEWLQWAESKDIQVHSGFRKIANEKTNLSPVLHADTPLVAQPSTEAKPVRHKLRTNSLDAPIKKAIEKANSLDTGAVWLQLRELALACESPFTGTREDEGFCYTNDSNQTSVNGKTVKLTKDALRKRLKSHFLPASNGG